MRFNPYIAGNPISSPNGFFGRDDIFQAVMQVLRHPQSNAIVLYGQRRTGKTSVLLQLERQLVSTGEFVPVYFDLQDKADKPLGDVLYELAQRIAGVVGQAAPERALFDDEGSYFRQSFLPQAAAQGKLVLLFDEFDVLDSPQQSKAGQTFFPYLRSWMADIQGVSFVLSSAAGRKTCLLTPWPRLREYVPRGWRGWNGRWPPKWCASRSRMVACSGLRQLWIKSGGGRAASPTLPNCCAAWYGRRPLRLKGRPNR
jgi:hypothetical protein